jgi:hypothetical protein
VDGFVRKRSFRNDFPQDRICNRRRQKQADQAGQSTLEFEKIWKRALKWSIFILISIIITHIMFMYIVGYEEVFRIMQQGPFEKPTNFWS